MDHKKPNFFLIWIVVLIVCATLQMPVWGILLVCVGYGVLVLLLRFQQSLFWTAYLIHGMLSKPETALKLYDYAYSRGARAGAPMIAYAMLLMERSRYAQALEILQEVQTRRDLNPRMRLISRQDLALALSKTGNTTAAIEEMEKIRQDHECLGSSFYGTLAYFYILAGLYDKAEEINTLSRTRPEDDGAYYDNLGLIAYRKGNLEEAEALFQSALEADEAMLSPRYHLGLLAEARGDTAEAKEFFRAVYDGGVTGLSTISPEAAEEKYRQYCQ